MTKPLLPIPSTLLGPAARGASGPAAEIAPDGNRWVVTWTDPAGRVLQSTAPAGPGSWSSATPLPAGHRPGEGRRDQAGPAGVLAQAGYAGGMVALRAGRRVPGIRPTFPGAGLIVSRTVADGWQDIAFADDAPDTEVFAAGLCVQGDNLLAAYLVADGRGGTACRALRLSLAAVQQAPGDGWRYLSAYPQPPGVAAVIAGAHGGVLIASGGANFPDQPPWEGGVKRTYDDIFVLPLEGGEWRRAGRLPAPRAYAAVVSVPDGVLAMAGENAAGVFQDAFFLRWEGGKVTITPGPSLPVALASPVATVLDSKVYLAGGYAAGSPRVSSSAFYCLDLLDLAAGWRPLPTWPGPSRALAVMATLSGAVYLISGLEMSAGADGQTKTNYLTDAYRYRPAQGWQKLPDLPWSVIAAPSPAPTTSGPERVMVLGGVDGRQVGKVPRDRRVPEDILYFDVARHEWRLWSEGWPEPVVSCPTVKVENEWFFISGETKAGHRTTAVVAWQPGPAPLTPSA